VLSHPFKSGVSHIFFRILCHSVDQPYPSVILLLNYIHTITYLPVKVFALHLQQDVNYCVCETYFVNQENRYACGYLQRGTNNTLTACVLVNREFVKHNIVHHKSAWRNNGFMVHGGLVMDTIYLFTFAFLSQSTML
jgi:hypothetical protein